LIREKVLQRIDFSKEIEEESIKEVIIREIASREEAAKYSIAQRMLIEKRVFNSLRKLDVLQELIEDDEVTEILVNGPNKIFYEKNGKMLEYEYSFAFLC
jgi:pilus assembly protein CpaF